MMPPQRMQLNTRFTILATAVLAVFSVTQGQEKDSAALTAEAVENANPVYQWIRAQKVRGIYYSNLQKLEYYQAAGAAGFNCVLNKDSGFAPDAPEPGLSFHTAQARLTHQTGQHYVACINFNSFTERKYTDHRYVQMIDGDGNVYKDTPSPLDKEFWNQSIKRRWRLLAEAAKTAPLNGAMIDFEMYGSEIVFYDRVGCLDYSDLAFNGFIADQKTLIAAAVPPKDRPQWLKKNGLEDKYVAYYQREIEEICRDIEREVHKTNPDFIIGFYSWGDKSLFYEACARGFGTQAMPVLLWPGTTYTSGYSKREVDDQVRRLQEIGACAVFIPGLWLWQYHPDNLGAAAYECAAHAGGFWLYGVYSMWPETASKRRVPHVNAAEYWASLKQANDEITALQKDPNHRTALRFDPNRTLYLAADPLLIAPKVSLRPFAAEASAVPPLDTQPPAAPIRNVGVYRARGEAGKRILFRVHSFRLGPATNGTVAHVIDPDNKLIMEERIAVGETKDIAVHCTQPGIYTLVCQSGHLCAAVNSEAAQFVIDAGKSGVHFMCRMQPMYFYVPKGVREFALTAEGQGVERFNLKLITPAGQAAFQKEDISAEETIAIAVPDGTDGQPWRLDLAPPTHGILEDVTVKLSDNIPPYFSPAEKRLLVPAK